MTTDQPLGSDARACQDVEECHLTDPHVQQILDREAADLHGRFTGIFSPETVRGMVLACFTELTARSIVHVHLPVLAQRFARERLEIIAKNEGTIVPNVPEVLFVCVHNAGRSQMAAALLHHHAKGRVVVRSAGSAPAERINPAVVEVMAELGLDLSRGFPKPLTTEAVQASDVVITMGCGDACPVFPGKRYLDWQLADPAGQGADTVRAIRDDIDGRVRALLDELVPAKT